MKATLGVLAAVAAPRAALAQGEAAHAPDAGFSRERVVGLARALAKTPYGAPAADLPEPFTTLPREAYEKIAVKPGAAIWAGEHRGFSLEPLHRSPIFTTPVELFKVQDGAATLIDYDPAQFDFGALKVPEKLPNLKFSGFRALRAQNGGEAAEWAAQFQGASFFRARAFGQQRGVTARGLSIRTADPRGEEFPIFRSFWIEKPTLGDNALVIHALLDSQSVTGAFRFTLRPGEATIIDTELTLFPRVELDHIGIASLQGVSLYTPLDRRRFDDARAAVADMIGLQMLTGKDEWLWRPLSNRMNLQLASFVDNNPKGFGFLTRNRDIAAFQDDDAHWEQHPSLWIEPLGEWGEGSVQLIEIPSESEVNQNIIAYWRPKQPLPAQKETSFAYRQFWCWEPPVRPPLAYVADSRGGRAPSSKNRRFIVVFAGEALGDPARVATLKPALSCSPGTAPYVHLYPDSRARTCRVVFDIDPGSEGYCEIRLVLQAGDDPISETWLYRWTS